MNIRIHKRVCVSRLTGITTRLETAGEGDSFLIQRLPFFLQEKGCGRFKNVQHVFKAQGYESVCGLSLFCVGRRHMEPWLGSVWKGRGCVWISTEISVCLLEMQYSWDTPRVPPRPACGRTIVMFCPPACGHQAGQSSVAVSECLTGMERQQPVLPDASTRECWTRCHSENSWWPGIESRGGLPVHAGQYHSTEK